MATRRRVDDSEEEEATAIDLRQSSKSSSRHPEQGAPAKKSVPAGPPGAAPAAQPPAARRTPMVDADDDEDATEFLSVRPRPNGQPAPTPRTPAAQPQSAPPSSRAMPSTPSEPALRARGRAVPLGASGDDAGQQVQQPQQQTAPPTSLAALPATLPTTMPTTSPTTSPPPRAPRDSTEPLVDVENLPRAPRPLPGNTNTGTASPLHGGGALHGRHAPIEESTTGSHTGTSSVPRITRIHVVSDTGSGADASGTGDDDDDGSENTLPPNGPASKKAAAMAQAIARAGLDKAALDKARVDDARPPEQARIRKVATIVQNLDDETQAPEHSDSTQAGSVTGEVRAPRPVPATADSEDGSALVADGTLVVEAPGDAVVVVNGVERGKGVVRVADLDRLARHAVRIHAPGFQPWSGSVTLEGKPAAKIRPTLKPRAR